MHGTPDGFRVFARSQRLLDRAPAEPTQHLRVRPHPRVATSEVTVESLPELTVPHADETDQAAEA